MPDLLPPFSYAFADYLSINGTRLSLLLTPHTLSLMLSRAARFFRASHCQRATLMIMRAAITLRLLMPQIDARTVIEREYGIKSGAR